MTGPRWRTTLLACRIAPTLLIDVTWSRSERRVHMDSTLQRPPEEPSPHGALAHAPIELMPSELATPKLGTGGTGVALLPPPTVSDAAYGALLRGPWKATEWP